LVDKANRVYVPNDIELLPTNFEVGTDDDIISHVIYYDTYSKNCYIAYKCELGSSFPAKGLTPFISPNGKPYKFDEELRRLYY
jgi:hypothetical protein